MSKHNVNIMCAFCTLAKECTMISIFLEDSRRKKSKSKLLSCNGLTENHFGGKKKAHKLKIILSDIIILCYSTQQKFWKPTGAKQISNRTKHNQSTELKGKNNCCLAQSYPEVMF